MHCVFMLNNCMQAVRDYTDALRKRRQERRSVLSVTGTGAPLPGAGGEETTEDAIERHERLIAREKDMQVEFDDLSANKGTEGFFMTSE